MIAYLDRDRVYYEVSFLFVFVSYLRLVYAEMVLTIAKIALIVEYYFRSNGIGQACGHKPLHCQNHPLKTPQYAVIISEVEHFRIICELCKINIQSLEQRSAL